MLRRKAREPELEKAANRKICPSGPGGSQVHLTLLRRTRLILSTLTTSFTSVVSPGAPKKIILELAAATGATQQTVCYGAPFFGGVMGSGKTGYSNCPCYSCSLLLTTIFPCDLSLMTRHKQTNFLELTPTPCLLLNWLKRKGC